MIGRRHSVDDFYRLRRVRAKSIPIINMDLIIGLPGEDATDIDYSLHKAVEPVPENLTIHTLTLKRSAALFGSKIQLPARRSREAGGAGQGVKPSKVGLEPYYLYRQHYMPGHWANIGYAKPGTESIL